MVSLTKTIFVAVTVTLTVMTSCMSLCDAIVVSSSNGTTNSTQTSYQIAKDEAALILLLGFGSLSILLAFLYIGIRRFVFDDKNNLDSTFDAGGNVSASLTAVTIAAQLLWPGDLLQSVTVVVKYGIAGVFWYCASALINLSLFPLLSCKFKTRAPGAKTYLQVILTRFGRPAHLVFCFFALLVNVVILTSILVGGIAVMQRAIHDASPEYCVLVIAALCGSYTFVGGLGSTFYVSYFNALTTFVVLSVLVFSVFYSEDKPFGSYEEIYASIARLPPAQGNRDGSYFTFLSEGAMMFAVQGLFLVSSITYCDQASWQSRVAAKPLQGAVGFLLAGVIWFAVPATIGTVTGITYLALSESDPAQALSIEEINSGVVSTYMSGKALGKTGTVMMLTMLTMLTMSTGSGEIMGVSSIVVYDIYQVYIRPFRSKLPSTLCVFCGDLKQEQERAKSSPLDAVVCPGYSLCKCPDPQICDMCKTDVQMLDSNDLPGKILLYKCPHHGNFRAYQDTLIDFKNWCILWVTVGLVPFGLVANWSGIDLNWSMLAGCVLVVPSFPGVILSIMWSKTTGKALIIGSLSGLTCGVFSDLLVAYIYYEGQGGFIFSTSELYSTVTGATVSMFVSLLVTVLVSLFTHDIRTTEDEEREWKKMRDIDNPLHPWTKQYEEEFPELQESQTQPSYSQLEHVSRRGRQVSIIGCIIFIVVFIILIPGVMASLEVLSESEFESWCTLINVWCLVMAVAIVVITPIEEVRAIIHQLRAKRKHRRGAGGGGGGDAAAVVNTAGDGSIKAGGFVNKGSDFTNETNGADLNGLKNGDKPKKDSYTETTDDSGEEGKTQSSAREWKPGFGWRRRQYDVADESKSNSSPSITTAF